MAGYGKIQGMRTIIPLDRLRSLLNDSRVLMGEQPWVNATDEHAEEVKIPHGKMEALHRLEHNEWVFIPVVRTQSKKGGKVIEHGFEIHRRDTGWEVITAALEMDGDKPAKVHAEAARNHSVQQELEKLRLRAKNAQQAA